METLELRTVPTLDLSGLALNPAAPTTADTVSLVGTIADDQPMDYAGVTVTWGAGGSAESALIPADPPVTSLAVDGYFSHTFGSAGTYTVTIQVDADIPDHDPDIDSTTITVTLTVPPPPPVVSMTPVNLWEGGKGNVLFTRSGDLTTGLTVAYTVGGNATPGTDPASGADYQPLSGTVTFAPGSDTATVTISAFHDQVYDPDEGVELTIYPTDQYQLPDNASSLTASNTILEDAAGTFITSNGTLGVYWYDEPVSGEDPDLAAQSVPLTNFVLQFGGQTITTSNATFTTSPTGDFAHGDLVNVRFAVTFGSPINGYASLSVDSGVATVIDANTLQPENVNVADTDPAILVLDFKTVQPDPNGATYTWVINAVMQDGTVLPGTSVNLPGTGGPDGTPTGWKNLIRDALNDVTNTGGWIEAKDDPDSDTRLVIKSAQGKQLKQLIFADNVSPGSQLPPGPKIHQRIQGGAAAFPIFTYKANN